MRTILNTLRIILSIRNTININVILHGIRSIPLIGKHIPEDIYAIRPVKIIVLIISVFGEILRAFFTQEDVPVWLAKYKTLFVYEAQREESLGNDFDERILEMVEQQEPVKARVLTLTQRLMPLFKAAAVVAIILTLGGALQAPWDSTWNTPEDYAAIQQADTMNVIPVQANISAIASDSIGVLQNDQPTD